MSTFHSTVSRREFMKGLGLAGVGAAALTTPVFHDLDEVISSDQANSHRPWWIKERDIENPTTEIDWNVMKRYLSTNSPHGGGIGLYMTAADFAANYSTPAAANKTKWMLDNRPGYRLQDKALTDQTGLPPGSTTPWLASSKTSTPTSLGVPKYTGTPEENSRLLRSALKFYGVPMIGYTLLTANTKKLVYSDGYDFENVALAYTNSKGINIIPDSIQMSVVEMAVDNPIASLQTGPSNLAYAGAGYGHTRVQTAAVCAQQFVIELGYQCMFGGYENTAPHPAFDVLSGIGELGRATNQTINPFAGMGITPTQLTTDFPLAPTNPIDAGIVKFCAACAKCADVCPSGANTNEALSWEVRGLWSNPGHQQFQNDMLKCHCFRTLIGQCSTCEASCVFTKDASSGIHEVVKATLATTPVFDSFFKKMDDAFGYGSLQFNGANNPSTGVFNGSSNDWWNLELPALGTDLNKKVY